MKIVPSSLRTFCGVHKETLEHLFINCHSLNDKLEHYHCFVVFDANAENHLLNEMYFGIYSITILRLKFPNPSKYVKNMPETEK